MSRQADIRDHYRKKVSLLLRSEMRGRGITYAELAKRTGRNAGTLQNQITRGAFTAKFFLECLAALGAHSIVID